MSANFGCQHFAVLEKIPTPLAHAREGHVEVHLSFELTISQERRYRAGLANSAAQPFAYHVLHERTNMAQFIIDCIMCLIRAGGNKLLSQALCTSNRLEFGPSAC